MTDREKAIVMAYTGTTMLTGDKLGIFYDYVHEKLGPCVMTHELAYQEVQDAIQDAAKEDFIALAKSDNGWISVKDRHPENHRCCLVSDGSGITFGFYRDGAWEGIPTEIDVRWWMLIPDPPKEGNVDERAPD